jgi:hypothetical protein
MTKTKHIHKYVRDKFPNGRRIYKCVLPSCHHYLLEQFIEGKESICWRCDEIFVITKTLADLKRPHCKKCTKGKNKETTESVTDFVSQFLGAENK